METIAQSVATSNATADIAYYVCIVSFFIAGGVAIYLLWDKIHETKTKRAARSARSSAARTTARKPAAKKAAAKRPAAKKTTRRTTTKKR